MSSNNNMFKYDEKYIDLRKVINVIKRRHVVFVVIILLSLTIGATLNFYILPPVYDAKTILLVTRTSDMQMTTINTFAGQVKSDVLMQRVIGKLNLEESVYSTRTLSRQIKVSTAKDSNLIEISVSDRNPGRAAEIANTLGGEFMLLTNQTNQEMVQHSVNSLRNQVNAIQKDMSYATGQMEKKLLEDTLLLLGDRARIARSIDLGGTGVVVLSPAITPVVPAQPDKVLNLVAALVAGLVVSTVLAFVREALDNTIKTPEDVERHLDLPVLGIILHPNRHSLN